MGLAASGSATDDGQGRVVHQTVGGHPVPAVRAGNAREVGETASRLLDHDSNGGQVPDRHRWIQRDLRGALGHQHVLPRIADAAGAPAAAIFITYQTGLIDVGGFRTFNRRGI